MRQAISLAQGALYVPAPNPRVGCVIARNGQVLARGSTQHVGGAHAEIMALRDLESQGFTAEGATVYISLEPCSHFGRTPPCVDALIKANPARVVFAHFDPNPSVAGRGLQALKAAGIEVTVGVCADDALEINPGFVSRMTRGVPYVWLKVAASLDGKTALPNGVSQWITGPQARADGHHWRARSCIVLTGIGTVRTDNPRLEVRHVVTPRPPQRGVIDPGLDISEDAALLAGGDAALLLPPEAVEDKPDAGVADLAAWETAVGAGPRDPVVVVGISCGLSATYVGSMLRAALERPGYTAVVVGFNPVEGAHAHTGGASLAPCAGVGCAGAAERALLVVCPRQTEAAVQCITVASV